MEETKVRKGKQKKENQLIENEGENKSFGYTVDLCGKDRAIGEGANTGVKADEIMASVNSQRKRVQVSATSIIAPAKKREASKDILAASLAKIASSYKELIHFSIQN